MAFHPGRKAAIAAVGLAVLAGAGGAVAATQNGSTNRSSEEQAYLNDLAGKLGVTPSALSAAIKATDSDQIDAALAAGRLSTAQADALKARLQASSSPLPGLGLGLGLGGHRFGGPAAAGGFADGLSAAVGYLGISEQTLRSDLRSGQSLDTIAAGIAGKSADGLKAAIIAAETARLDTAVSDGTITSAQEQQRLSALSSRLDGLLAQSFSGRGGPGGPAGAWGGGRRGFGRGRYGATGPSGTDALFGA